MASDTKVLGFVSFERPGSSHNMQDCHTASCIKNDTQFFGVFDGHGGKTK